MFGGQDPKDPEPVQDLWYAGVEDSQEKGGENILSRQRQHSPEGRVVSSPLGRSRTRRLMR